MGEEVVQQQLIFCDTESNVRHLSSNRFQLNTHHFFKTNAQEFFRLSLQSITGHRSFWQINESNRVFFIFFNTEDCQYLAKCKLEVGDFDNEQALAENFIYSVLNNTDKPNATNLTKFVVSADSTTNNTSYSSVNQDGTLGGYKRQLNCDFSNIKLTVNDGGSDKIYTYDSKNRKLQDVKFLFPKNRDFGQVDEFQNTYRILGGQKETTYNIANLNIDDNGCVESFVDAPQNDGGTANLQLTYDSSTEKFKIRDDSGSTIGTGESFFENTKEMNISANTTYRIKLSPDWFNLRVALKISKGSSGDGINNFTLGPGMKSIKSSTTQPDYFDIFVPQDNNAISTTNAYVDVPGSALENCFFTYVDFSGVADTTLKYNNIEKLFKEWVFNVNNNAFQNSQLPLVLSQDKSTTVIDSSKLVNPNYGKTEAEKLGTTNVSNSLTPFIKTSSSTSLNDITISGGELYINGQFVHKGLVSTFTVNGSTNVLNVSGYAPMDIFPEKYVYLRTTGGDNYANGHYTLNQNSNEAHLEHSNIFAKIPLQGRYFAFSSNETSTSRGSGFFINLYNSTTLNILEFELTDSEGRNPFIGADSFKFGNSYMEMVLRLDKIRYPEHFFSSSNPARAGKSNNYIDKVGSEMISMQHYC
jgi:hypothetical protein